MSYRYIHESGIKLILIMLLCACIFVDKALSQDYYLVKEQSENQVNFLKNLMKDSTLTKHYDSLTINVNYSHYNRKAYFIINSLGWVELNLFYTEVIITTKNKIVFRKVFVPSFPETIQVAANGNIPINHLYYGYGQIDFDEIYRAILHGLSNKKIESIFISNKNDEFRLAAVRESTNWKDSIADNSNQKYFAMEVSSSKNEEIIEKALYKLDPTKYQNLLFEATKPFHTDNVREIAISRLNPKKWQMQLIEIAKKDRNEEIRCVAISKLDSIKCKILLEELAKNDTIPIIRHSSIERLDVLTSQEIFAEIAKNDNNPNVRHTAVLKLDSQLWQNLLMDLVKNEKDVRISTYALSKLDSIKSQDFIVSIVKNSEKHLWIRMDAINKLDDTRWQDLFADIACNDEDANICELAVTKLESSKSQDLLAKIACTGKNKFVREAAIKKLLIIKWQDVFAKLAKTDESSDVRIDAIQLLYETEWQDLLADIAINDEYSLVRLYALEKLDNKKWQNLFFTIADNNKEDDENRNYAVKMIISIKSLNRIAMNNYSNDKLRLNIEERIKQIENK